MPTAPDIGLPDLAKRGPKPSPTRVPRSRSALAAPNQVPATASTPRTTRSTQRCQRAPTLRAQGPGPAPRSRSKHLDRPTLHRYADRQRWADSSVIPTRRSERPAFIAELSIRVRVMGAPHPHFGTRVARCARFVLGCSFPRRVPRGGDPARSLGWQPTPTSRCRRSTFLDRPHDRLTDVGYGSVSVISLRAVRE